MKVVSELLQFIYREWRGISLLSIVLISVVSLLPLAQLPLVPGSDKTHHLVSYAALALPIALRGRRAWWLLIVAALIWSGIIELIQPHINRYGEWLDLIANGAGLFIGSIAGIGLRKFIDT